MSDNLTTINETKIKETIVKTEKGEKHYYD